MSERGRPRLSLRAPSLLEPAEERDIEIGVFDLVLPCRSFDVTHKVAELGRVSLTTEFMLRLLKSVDGIAEDDAAKFFGYSRRDMTFVISEVETNDYVERKDGRLWMTSAGRSLFRDEAEEPTIFEVEKRTERVGFDLIALAPQDRGSLSPFDYQLPELKPKDANLLSAVADRIPGSFRRFYTEIVSRRQTDATRKRSLYSIDSVSPGDRFSSLVRLTARSSGQRPGFPEPDLGDWRPPHEQDDRAPIVESAARFLEGLKTDRRAGDSDAFEALTEICPTFLRDFIRRDGFAVERYYREAVVRAGELRSDRHTAPILGSLFTKESTARLFDALKYGLESRLDRPSICLWVVPQVSYWGATSALPELISQLERHVLGSPPTVEEKPAWSIALVAGQAPRYLGKAFDRIAEVTTAIYPPALELLIVPNIVTAIIVHSPMIGARESMPVPLGVVSFDRDVVSNAQKYVRERISYFKLDEQLVDRLDKDMVGIERVP